jgi:hypothetical protein
MGNKHGGYGKLILNNYRQRFHIQVKCTIKTSGCESRCLRRRVVDASDASPTRRQRDDDASPMRCRRDADASPTRRRGVAEASPTRRRRDDDALPTARPRRRHRLPVCRPPTLVSDFQLHRALFAIVPLSCLTPTMWGSRWNDDAIYSRN